MVKIIFVFLILIVSVFGAEQENTVYIPTVIANVHSGMATVTGRLITEHDRLPVRLAEVYRQGEAAIFVLDWAYSPGVDSDSDGYFYFENLEAVEYAIVIGNPVGRYQIVPDGDKAFTFVPAKAVVTDLGDIIVELNNDND